METQCGFDHAPAGADLLAMYGPTLLVDVGFDASYLVGQGKIPTPGIQNLQALVDTGASDCCIDGMLAITLELPIVDRRELAGAHGSREVNMHMAQIRVPSLNFTMYGQFAAVDLNGGGQKHVALIGRSFLRYFTMSYEGRTGKVIIKSP